MAISIKVARLGQLANSQRNTTRMKLLHLLISLCLAILLCTAPLIQAQTAPTVPAAPPTPPNGQANGDGPPPPPNMDVTVPQPPTATTVIDYAG